MQKRIKSKRYNWLEKSTVISQLALLLFINVYYLFHLFSNGYGIILVVSTLIVVFEKYKLSKI